MLVWVAVAAIGGPYFGKIEEVSSNDPATFLPESAESTRVNDELEKFRDTSSVPAIVVFSSDDTLDTTDRSEIDDVRQEIVDSQLAADDVPPVITAEDERGAFVIVPIASEADFAEVVPELQAVVEETDPAIEYGFTGPALFSRDLQNAFGGIDGTLLAVALSVVFVILLFVYRSPLLPIVTLVGAISALAAAILVVFYLAKADIVMLNGQVQGILFILVIGAATDYSLLYIARYREELKKRRTAFEATIATWKASFEPILAAGGTVILGLLCLLASDLGSNQALGPVGGLGIAFAMLVALTYLPAMLLLLGRVAFWPRRPEYTTKKSETSDKRTHPTWSRVADLVSKHPRRIWFGVTVALVAACFFVPQLQATGVSQDNLILGPSDARDGQALLDKHFPSGSGTPAYVIVPREQQDDVVELLDAEEGVESVSVVSSDDEQTSAPVGQYAEEVDAEIRRSIEAEFDQQRVQIRQSIQAQNPALPEPALNQAVDAALQNAPSIDTLVAQANPFDELTPQVIDDRVLLEATLVDEASSTAAKQTIDNLRSTIQQDYPEVEFGGISAIQLDTQIASDRDLVVVIPLILLAITIVLTLLLRSIVAPLVLVLTTVISFGATIGIAALLFNHVWDFPGADPSVIIFGFVFLVALGIDYNIFLMTRVREETKTLGVRRGTLKALVVTGGVITSAGIVLAATFAALFVIPILFLAQIAFIVAFGVLLDTLIVRSLLVPALTMEIGRLMWWPSKLWKGKK